MPIDAFASPEKSTIVRSLSSRHTDRAMPSAARAISRLMPRLVARLAEHQLFRPPRRKVPGHEAALLATADPIAIGLGPAPPLRAWSWSPNVDVPSGRFRLPKTAMLIHGWAGRGGQLAAFAKPLVEQGYRVVAFDAPGHGRSPGRRTSLLAMADAILETAAWVGGVQALIAHSAGAAAATLAIERGLVADRVAFISPVDDISALMTRYAGSAGLTQDVINRIRAVSERRLGIAWSSLRTSGLAVYRHEPLLVVHDLDDRDVPISHGRRIAHSWRNAEQVTTEGLGHRRILRDADVLTRVTDFIDRDEIERARGESQGSASHRHGIS